MLKRISLFVITNLAVVFVLSIVARLFGLEQNPNEYIPLLIFASLFGFGGALISLLLSKWMAKRSTGAHMITEPANETERWLADTVAKLAETAKVKMPEVGIYQGEPNAFATGATRNSSLVCVSTGLLQSMNQKEIEAVLAHEMSHVANGDMVTLTLIQGIVNTFVIFLSRLVAGVIANMISRNNNSSSSIASSGVYYMVAMICQIVFGILASIIVCYFSRRREYRADAGAAYLLGSPRAMIAALNKLKRMQSGDLPDSMAALGISDKPSKIASLFSTHPPLEDRISALENNLSSFTLDA